MVTMPPLTLVHAFVELEDLGQVGNCALYLEPARRAEETRLVCPVCDMNLDLRALLRTIEEKVIMNGERLLHHLLGVPLFSTSRASKALTIVLPGALHLSVYGLEHESHYVHVCSLPGNKTTAGVHLIQKVIRCSECSLEVLGISHFVFQVLSSCTRIVPSGHHLSSAIPLQLTSHLSTSCSVFGSALKWHILISSACYVIVEAEFCDSPSSVLNAVDKYIWWMSTLYFSCIANIAQFVVQKHLRQSCLR